MQKKKEFHVNSKNLMLDYNSIKKPIFVRLGIKPNRLQLEFAQRYIYGGSYRKISWSDYAKERGLL